MASVFGNALKVPFRAVPLPPSAVIDGLPAGFKPDRGAPSFMLRRAPGRMPRDGASWADNRNSLGLVGGATGGAPLPPSSATRTRAPATTRACGHSAPVARRFRRAGNSTGAGLRRRHFSGRLTALCFAGGLCLQLLRRRVARRAYRVRVEADRPFDPTGEDIEALRRLAESDFPSSTARARRCSLIDEARAAGFRGRRD